MVDRVDDTSILFLGNDQLFLESVATMPPEFLNSTTCLVTHDVLAGERAAQAGLRGKAWRPKNGAAALAKKIIETLNFSRELADEQLKAPTSHGCSPHPAMEMCDNSQ